MRRVLSWLNRAFSLSPEGRAFFYVTAFAHIALKTLLGLKMALQDGYGFASMVAPPQSLVLVGGDVLISFLFAKQLDFLKQPMRRVLQSIILLPLAIFLVTDFIIHTYFKAFLNRGVLQFNGASPMEIADYTIAGITPFSLAFILIVITLFAFFVLAYSRIGHSRLFQSQKAIYLALATALLFLTYSRSLSAGQSGFMKQPVAYVFFYSYITASASQTLRASAQEAKEFNPPAPLYGKYDSRLDVHVDPRPDANVLFFIIESLPLEQTQLGGARGQLPVLSELADNGIFFQNFRTIFPATSRSFLTFHCGIYPTTGDATVTKLHPDYTCESILDATKKAGYRSGFFTSNMANYDNLDRSPIMGGYDEREDFLTLRDRAAKNSVDAPAVEEEAVVDALFEFLTKPGSQPWFVTYFLYWSHAPYRLPFEDISSLSTLERYKRCLAYLDKMIRSVLQRAQSAELLKNTIIVVAADHGEGFGIHHSNTTHSGHIYEDDIRIPFVIHVPGIGKHVSLRNATNLDFAPTLAYLLQLPQAPSWQGQNMLAAEFASRPILIFGRASYKTNGVVDGNLKYIEYPDDDERHFYDLAQDPHELNDLYATQKSRANEYSALIQRWLPVAEERAWAVDKAKQ